MIDKDLITRKILLISEDLKALEQLASRPVAEYVASPTDEVLAERYLERIIGRMIDINYHVLTESGQAPPRDYYDSFTALAGIGMLDREICDAYRHVRGAAEPDRPRVRNDRSRARTRGPAIGRPRHPEVPSASLGARRAVSGL